MGDQVGGERPGGIGPARGSSVPTSDRNATDARHRITLVLGLMRPRAVAVAEVEDEAVEVGGEGGLDVDAFPGDRVDEAEGLGVQGLSGEAGLGAGLVAGAVDGV